MTGADASAGPLDLAIIGIAGRWPGANTIAAFWDLLLNGREAMRTFSDEELRARGVPHTLLCDPHFIKRAAVLDDAGAFAAVHFGYSPREAMLMDPQHRLFLECAWEALEDAGYAPRHVPRQVGVFASCSLSSYLLFNILDNPRVNHRDESFQAMIGTDKDFLATRVSYKLNLTGPSLTVQTGCSSSLVAVCLATQSLLTYQCDIALVGGVSVGVPQRTGYLFQPGGITSSDGHCRPFSASAGGTLFGDGAGIVVLKRLGEAQADGDHIYAVIKGCAMNNDGAAKVGYVAPSVAGQAAAVRGALAMADVSAASISYVEGHGTATALGDPAEVTALTQAFHADTVERGFCALGSVKGNVGHLDAAAGVTGLIKTALMLSHRTLVPSLHWAGPSKSVDLEATPFFVNTSTRTWETEGPRRAGVSSFGIGGTNAHVVLEEPPLTSNGAGRAALPARSACLIALSADTSSALERTTDRLAAYLKAQPAARLGDVAFTMQVGRESYNHRRTLVCESPELAAAALATRDPERVRTCDTGPSARRVVFMFPGGASQYAGMGHQLYRSEPRFAAEIDRCAAILLPLLGSDLRSVMFPSEPDAETADRELQRLSLALPAIFSVSYAMACLLQQWGVRAAGLIGHSLGEYVAACLSGVFSLADALALVALRGSLIDALPPGAMLSVNASEAALREITLPDVAVAAINGPETCVLSGTPGAIAHAAEVLAARQVESTPLAINAAAHSAAVEPIAAALRARLRQATLQPPVTPFVSNLTGTWITREQATDVEYWIQHLRRPVRFSDGLATLGEQSDLVYVEVGPGRTLSSLARRHPATSRAPAIAAMRHAREQGTDETALCAALGRLWMSGVPVDWPAYQTGRDVRRISLPTYPFERQHYWLDPASRSERTQGAERLDPADWCHTPHWTRTWPPRAPELGEHDRARAWILIADRFGVTDALQARLDRAGIAATGVELGRGCRRIATARWVVTGDAIDDYRRVLRELSDGGRTVRVVHAATLTGSEESEDDAQGAAIHERGFLSLVALARAADEIRVPLEIMVVTNHLEQVGGFDRIVAAKGTLRATSLVLPQELEALHCKVVDVGEDWIRRGGAAEIAAQLISECDWTTHDRSIAWRGSFRWARLYTRLAHPLDREAPWPPRPNGVYLLTGGTGQLGITLARWLGRDGPCRLALTSRSGGERDKGFATDLEALRAAGHAVVVYAANVADADAMRQVIDDIDCRWGRIDAVFHLAGLTGAAALRAVSDLTSADCLSHLEAKETGTAVLQRLLRDRRADVCVTFSSTASILGGVGMLPYAAANAVLDTAAWGTGTELPRWISVNWDGWMPSDRAGFGSRALDRYAMQPRDALDVLGSILASGVCGQVVVSTGDLATRLADWTGRRTVIPGVVREAHQPRPPLQTEFAAPQTALEELLAGIWAEVLGIDAVGRHDNLFELGGDSLIALRLVARIKAATGQAVPVTALFEAPTVHTLATLICAQPENASPEPAIRESPSLPGAPDPTPPVTAPCRPRTKHPDAIAIVGMAGRFPGAATVRDLWTRLANGDELIQALGGPPPSVREADSRWVRAAATLEGYDLFDAEFFGITPAEAALHDPQHRLLLETAWAALEDAGHDSRRDPRRVGVFAGATTNTYLTHHLAQRVDVLEAFDPVQINVANGSDFLTTLVSYKLDLTGPSHTVQSACSTSLVAVHCACRSLLQRECELAMAGGVSVNVTLFEGYRYVQGGMMSADGHCRAFDARATGTVFGSGVGMVVLKRLEDALADGNTIHAVIRGSAVNNDGALKAGYTTPSVDGQARVIEAALRAAQLDPDAISYVECHGTGTALGDPIEIQALTKALKDRRHRPTRARRCAIGSVKTNVGHLDAAAGVTGLIKVVLSLAHGQLPPTLHFEQANPHIDFDSTPFFVNTRLTAWPAGGSPRCAGVSAFGVGGTNAHLIVEEPPPIDAITATDPWHLLVWSAKTEKARDEIRLQLARFLRDQSTPPALADVAYTLQIGRRPLAWRGAVVCGEVTQAIAALDTNAGVMDGRIASQVPPIVFRVTGDDATLLAALDDLRQLYRREGVYRAEIDACTAAVPTPLERAVRALVCGDPADVDGPTLVDRRVSQVALFAVAQGLIALWRGWGVHPSDVVGEGAGASVAACAANRVTREEALRGIAEDTGLDARDRSRPGVTLDRASIAVEIGPAHASLRAMLMMLGRLWIAGVEIDWVAYSAGAPRRRVSLPTYPFQRTRHWIARPAERSATAAVVGEVSGHLAVPPSAPPVPSAPLIAGNRPQLRNRYVTPRTAREKTIVSIVESVLGVHPIGLTDRFGELGGDSLQAVRLVEVLNSRLGCCLQPVDLFENATVGDLVAVLDELNPDAGASECAPAQ